jgi:hypothetical protein
MSVMHTVETSKRMIVDHFRWPNDFTNIGDWGDYLGNQGSLSSGAS